MPVAVKRIEGHYEVQEVPFGKVYRWRPKHLVAECGCGEIMNLTASSTATCHRCGVNHEANLREERDDKRLEEETLHPWRYTGNSEGGGIPC